ncbi:MAG: PepSY-like domain-containing protein [Bacteroidia bacterium]|nr:PepSY-like domain-containing protein [Bacteroidia bacterium]
MKRLNFFFALTLVISFLAVGCSRVSLSPSGKSEKIAISDIPADASSYISTNFSTLTIVKVEKKYNADGTFKKYEVYMSNGVELYFDINWNPIFGDDSGNSSSNGTDDSFDIPYSDLPQVVQDYMSQNYPNADVDKVKKKINDDGSARSYEIRLKDKTKLYFNGAGQFTGIDK